MMTRLPAWPRRLTAYMEDCASRRYALGVWDCAIFSAQGVEAVTGTLPVALVGTYGTQRAMLRAMRTRFGGGLAAGVDSVLGVPRRPVRLARRGDVLLRVDAAGVEHLALCDGPVGVAPAEMGLAARPLSDFASCWGVG